MKWNEREVKKPVAEGYHIRFISVNGGMRVSLYKGDEVVSLRDLGSIIYRHYSYEGYYPEYSPDDGSYMFVDDDDLNYYFNYKIDGLHINIKSNHCDNRDINVSIPMSEWEEVL
jgi:hypothetical protein